MRTERELPGNFALEPSGSRSLDQLGKLSAVDLSTRTPYFGPVANQPGSVGMMHGRSQERVNRPADRDCRAQIGIRHAQDVGETESGQHRGATGRIGIDGAAGDERPIGSIEWYRRTTIHTAASDNDPVHAIEQIWRMVILPARPRWLPCAAACKDRLVEDIQIAVCLRSWVRLGKRMPRQ